jgi:hypothetical protein
MGFRVGGSPSAVLCLVVALNIYSACAREAWGQAGPPGEVISSARVQRAITPADNVPLALGPTRYVYISQAAACTLAVILADDTAALTLSVPAALAVPFMPLRAKVVMATGTTCTPVVGLW